MIAKRINLLTNPDVMGWCIDHVDDKHRRAFTYVSDQGKILILGKDFRMQLTQRRSVEMSTGILYRRFGIGIRREVAVNHSGKTLISVTENDRGQLDIHAHFYGHALQMKERSQLYIDANNTFLKSKMLPSMMWKEILSLRKQLEERR